MLATGGKAMPTKIPEYITSIQINGSDAAAQRPMLALESARVFAKWANVEFVLASAVSMIVGDATALALIDKFKAKNAQYDAIKITLEGRISCAEVQSLISPLFKLMNKAAEPRNKLAHSLWGTIEELPEALLLTEPKAALKMSRYMLSGGGPTKTWVDDDNKTNFERGFEDNIDLANEMINVLRDGTEVWVHNDFNEPLRLLDYSIVALSFFTTAASAKTNSSEAIQALDGLRKILSDTNVLR